jgi:hypothetical protein
MTVIVESVGGNRAPAALALHIDAGATPAGWLHLTSASGSTVRIHMDHADLMALTNALASDPRLIADKSKWTKKDRQEYDDALNELIGGLPR